MGEGVDKGRLMALVRERALNNVEFLSGSPRHEVPSVLASCNALLVILRQDPLFEITIPSKVYEYMAAGKPILCSVGGETAALISQAKCGVPVAPSDSRALAEGIRTLMHSPELCRAFGEAGRAWARAQFSRSSLMENYANFLEGLTNHSHAPVETLPQSLERMASKRT
jgi:colanic acid biosynthesis glycosyl transferase WcaI